MQHSILLVSMGGFCRAPMGHALLKHIVSQRKMCYSPVHVDYAGLGDWHIGEMPDDRAILVADNYGLDITGYICKKITRNDFFEHDVILGMDHEIVSLLSSVRPKGSTTHIDLFLNYAAGENREIEDPYMYGDEVFAKTFHDMEMGVLSLVKTLPFENHHRISA